MAYLDMTDFAALGASRDKSSTLDLRERAARLDEKLLTDSGQADMARASLQKLNAQLFF